MNTLTLEIVCDEKLDRKKAEEEAMILIEKLKNRPERENEELTYSLTIKNSETGNFRKIVSRF